MAVFTQVLPHLVVPPLQMRPQAPPEQTCPDGQALPQEPQLAGSMAVFTQVLPHLVVPPLQARLPASCTGTLTQIPERHRRPLLHVPLPKQEFPSVPTSSSVQETIPGLVLSPRKRRKAAMHDRLISLTIQEMDYIYLTPSCNENEAPRTRKLPKKNMELSVVGV